MILEHPIPIEGDAWIVERETVDGYEFVVIDTEFGYFKARVVSEEELQKRWDECDGRDEDETGYCVRCCFEEQASEWALAEGLVTTRMVLLPNGCTGTELLFTPEAIAIAAKQAPDGAEWEEYRAAAEKILDRERDDGWFDFTE